MNIKYWLISYRLDHNDRDNWVTYHNDVVKGNWVDEFRELHAYNHDDTVKEDYVLLNVMEITKEEFKEFEGYF